MSNPFDAAPFDLRTAVTSQRRVMIFGPLDAPAATNAAATLMFLDGTSAEPVTVVVNSPGGPIADAMSLVDTIAVMRAPVTLDVVGRAHGSAGALVASAPGVRRITASASVALRLDRVVSPAGRTAGELATFADGVADAQRRLALVLGTRCGQTIEWVTEQFDRGGIFGPDEAIEHGLLDELRQTGSAVT